MRVIAFGCSYTYGHGLSDCLDNNGLPGPLPSKLAYPSLLASKLNYDCINLGKSGNSNKEIWNDILNFSFQQGDVAIITWTYYSRFCIIKDKQIKRINPWNNEDKIFYMNYSNRHDMITDFYGRLNHISFYLDSIGIQNYNYVIEDLESIKPIWNTSNILGVFKKIDEADDLCHPGVKSHQSFANDIFTQISI